MLLKIYFRVINLIKAQLFVWLREWLSCVRKWLSRDAIACLFMFKNVNEQAALESRKEASATRRKLLGEHVDTTESLHELGV